MPWPSSSNSATFDEFLKTCRPQDHPVISRKGRRPSSREKLKYIAAHRLHRHFQGPGGFDLVKKQVKRVIDYEAMNTAFYRSEQNFIAAANKGEELYRSTLRAAEEWTSKDGNERFERWQRDRDEKYPDAPDR